MTLDLQPYNENENTTLDLQPLNFENTKRFQGSISATPEYNAFDKIGTMLKNIADIPMHAIKQGSANVRTGELNFKLMFDGLDELEHSELNELENRVTYNYGAKAHSGLFDDSAFTDVNVSNFGERFKNTALSTIGQSTESYPFMAEIMKSGGVGGIAGGMIGGIAGGVINTAKSGFAGTLSGFKNGALLGAKVLGGAGSAKKAIELEAGLAYQELKNMKDDEGNLIDPELAKRLALSVGIANASLEMTGAIAELSTFPMADKLLKSAKIEAIKNIIKDKTLSNKLLSAGSKALTKHYAMDGLETAVEKATKENINKLAKATITEMTTEGLQELSNVVATEWAKQIEGNYSDAIFSESGINSNAFKENMARIVQAGAMAFVPAFTIGGIGTTATAVNIARKKAQVEGLNPDEAERIVRNLTLEQQSEIINNNEETLKELADEQFSEEKFVEIQDQSFNKMINAGMSEAEAFSTAKVVAEMAKSFNNVEVATNWADNLTFVSDKALQGQVEMNINTADVPEVMFQSAMYNDKSSNNVLEFYNNVQNNFANYKTAKYQFKNNKLSLPADTIRHDEKHNLTADDWQEIENNINKIYIANKVNDKSSFGDNLYNFGIKTEQGNYYYLCVALNNKDNYIVTAVKNTKKGVDSYVKGKGKTLSKVPNALPPVAPFSRVSSNNIIKYLKRNFNPESDVYFQPAYHGTPHKFDEFSTEHIGSGEGNQAHGWGLYFAGDKNVSEEYRKALIQGGSFGELIKDVKIGNFTLGHVLNRLGYSSYDMSSLLTYTMSGFQKENKEQIINKLNEFIELWESLPQATEWQKETSQKYKKLIKELERNNIINTKKGQLFEVDIPESDVLLDEQKTFTEQPKLIQESINKIFEEKKPSDIISEKIKWFDSMLNELEQKAIKDGGYTTQTNYSRNLYEEKISDLEKLLEKLNNYSELKGKDIYKILSIVYEGDKEASLLLNEYGIKGITYDGQQDGRCYVIFDDKAIDVIQTYYQENKAIHNAEKYLDKKQSVVKNLYDIHNDFIEVEPDDYTGKRTIKDVLSYMGSKDNKTANIKTPIENITITRSNVKHLLEDNENERSNNINKVIRTLQNPNLIIKETENESFKNYYVKVFKTDNKKTAHLQVIKCCNDGNFYVTNFHLKNGKFNQLLKNGQIIYDLSDKSAVQNTPDTNIITDNSDNFNPGNDNFARPKTLEEIHEDVRQRAKGMQYLGYFTQYQGKDIIGIMENSNASTVLHELAHSYLNSLRTLALKDADMSRKYEAVKKWLGVVGNNEPTVAQHEKFAEGFEAYIYSGQAPNKNLQSVFIQFKNWLKEIHDYWLNREDFQMPSDVKEVFDTIFEDNPKVISKRKKIKTYLDKALSIKVSDTLPLLDSEKRHKDFAYDIVSIATGYNVRYLKAILNTADGKSKDTQKEEIARRCAECDDRITNNGFNPEWTEFYSNASFYEGNDYLLAEQALSDIVNDNFNSNYTTVDYFNEFQAQYEYLINAYKNEILERDEILATVYKWLDHIGQKDYESFEIFLDKFEKDFNYISSFENASALEQAKLEILELAKNTKHLNLAGKFNKISENMDKISEKIKELNYTADVSATENQKTNSINIDKENVSTDVEAYREAVKEILNKLDFLTPNDKAKMFANIIDAPSATFLEARIEKVMDLANTLCEVQQRNELLDAITKELKSTENIKQNNKLVGKYNYRTNKLFATLRSIMKMTAEEANDVRIERQEQISEAESEGMSFEDRIINLMLQVKSDGRTYANTALIKQLYDDICALKLVGKNAKSEEELFNKLNNKQNIDEVVSILEAKKEGNIFEKFYVNTVANWESMLNTFFSKVIKNKYSLIWNETKSSTWIHKEKTQFEKEVQKIYGLSKWNFDAEILKALSDEYKFDVRTYDKTIDEEGKTQWVLRRIVPMKMNRMQIILAYMWDKNEVLHERMVNMFGEETLIDMIDNLSEQDRRLGDLMMRTVNKYYPLANEQYIKKYGIDLPKVSAYFPSVTEREGSLSELDLFRDFTQKSTSPSFSKMRSESTHVEMKFGNPVAMLYHHIDTMGRFINMTEPLDRINKVFNNSDVKKLIKYKYGETALKEFMQQLVDISYKQNATVRSEQMRIVNAMVSNWTSANIIGKMTTGIKQLFACLNYSTVMPVNEWNVRFLKAISEPKKTIQYMYEKIDYLRYRFESGSQNEALKEWVENNQIEEWFYKKIDDFVKNENVLKMLKSSTITVPRKIKDVASLFLRCGDMGAIIFGGKPYIDYLIEVKGLTEEQAIQEFVVETQRTQQSAEISTLSNWQVASTQNPFSKLFMNYKNAQGQFLRKIADSLINYKRGDIDKTQLAKDLFMYGYFQSFLFKIATSLSILTLINTGDADDLLKDIGTSIYDNLTFFHAFGDIGVGLMNRFFTGETTQFNSPLLSDIPREVLKVAKKDAEIKDFIHAIGFAVQLGKGIPVNAMVNSISGLGDIAQGEIQKGLLRALGNTENRANIATGQKKNKTKKNNSSKRQSLY